MPSRRGLLLSDFNLRNLQAILRNSTEEPSIEILDAPFGQVDRLLIDADDPLWGPGADFAFVWVRPEAVLPTFRSVSAFACDDTAPLLHEVDAFAERVQRLEDRVETVILASWLAPRSSRGLGPIDLGHPLGLRRNVLEANARLVEALGRRSGVFILDAEDWMRADDAGESDRLRHLAKIPFTNEVFLAAARDIRAVLRTVAGAPRKLIVLDLDDTLWGGLVGEVGWESLTLGGHDPDGEAYVEFQQALKELNNRGILLAIASKNDPEVALEAIDRHPEMVLTRTDFAASRIGWTDKARGIREIAAELGLGLDSVVFIDDSEPERARVRESLPEVFVPEWSRSPSGSARRLRGLTCFDSSTFTVEDRHRATRYRGRREIESSREEATSLEEWLAGLETALRVQRLDSSNLSRAAQLLNKTNQMNLATRRLTPDQVSLWSFEPDREMWTFAVTDRFGYHGLTGLLGLERRGRDLEIVDFVVSCRVIGRNLEQSMLSWAVSRGRALACDAVVARYRPTDRNGPCLRFFEASGFDARSAHEFAHDPSSPYEPPRGVTLQIGTEGDAVRHQRVARRNSSSI